MQTPSAIPARATASATFGVRSTTSNFLPVRSRSVSCTTTLYGAAGGGGIITGPDPSPMEVRA